jgi:hypothetical protein
MEALWRMFQGGKETRESRPYLKLCERCHGKGQMSYHDKHQTKTYGACLWRLLAWRWLHAHNCMHVELHADMR